MKTMMSRGVTVIELLIVIAIIVIIAVTMFGLCMNNRGATEARAMEGANVFIAENGLDVARLGCAGDSNLDGYGTCNIVLNTGEKVLLNCPTDFMDTKIWGATGCKEVYQNLNHQGGIPVQSSGL